MGTIGAGELLGRYGTYDAVAEAWLEGKLGVIDQRYVTELINKTDLEAARIRIEMRARMKAPKELARKAWLAACDQTMGADWSGINKEFRDATFEEWWDKESGKTP